MTLDGLLDRNRPSVGDLLGPIEPIPHMLLTAPDLPGQRRLPASQIDSLLQRLQSIHAGIYTTLGVISQQPRVFADEQLSCYVRKMKSKPPKPKKFLDWRETKSFSDRVTWAREERKLTQTQLAERIKCTQQSIGKAEHPKAKGSSYTVQMAAELSVNALWLALGEGEPDMNLKDVTSEAINLALALSYLPSDAKSPLIGRLLANALPFIPATHPRYKSIEAIYIKTMDSAVKEAAQAGSSGKRPPKPPVEVVMASGDLPERSESSPKRMRTSGPSAANDPKLIKKEAAKRVPIKRDKPPKGKRVSWRVA